MDLSKLTPQHVNKRFANQASFNAWLDKTYDKKIILSDFGQDMTKLYIDEHGEILHCNFHAHIYNGRFVNTESLTEFVPLEILENGSWKRKDGLLIEEIKNNKKL
ncbi:hypothetical protein GGR32_000153 [Mesonia hippocampi]|uniref:Uncharacterized protein n=1 Tax=Mesonia hippocampi TaxID=1628250 RepID=A0A840ELA8_9FLAO|nr:hypothetical protein [Mesonia hippocampi]MBB4117881.1 hypothetical protein [Mesonia hippocampi]